MIPKSKFQSSFDDLLTQPEDREACIRAGMDDYLGKPINPDDMFLMLLHWLEKCSGKVA